MFGIDELGVPGLVAAAVVVISAMDHLDELPTGLRIDRY